ncbi:hypothetical protein GOP47_0001782 [Adiantum capillus-veneris]|uniref:Uncharacterized protein n=1 Tax=Adiantum capillus-veneris TaxID=13818 RepID=A0A9D4V9L5_ADICA|nr:hypothetical protein GOP47_0001782 [Adiantum capillus-veneris]
MVKGPLRGFVDCQAPQAIINELIERSPGQARSPGGRLIICREGQLQCRILQKPTLPLLSCSSVMVGTMSSAKWPFLLASTSWFSASSVTSLRLLFLLPWLTSRKAAIVVYVMAWSNNHCCQVIGMKINCEVMRCGVN